jgi:glycerol kinase
MAILAIDQGTTSTRALRVDESGHASITHSIPHRQLYPAPGRVEHDPEELIRSIEQCLAENPDLSALGIDNQGESCLAWHADTRKPICPVIVWQDNRTQDVIERLKADGADDMVMQRAGLPLDSYFSATKLSWILENVDEAASLRRLGKLRIGTTDAYFMDRLGNRFATDITTASRTSLLNIETGQWDEELCDLFGVPMELLPPIVPSTGELAEIRSGALSVPLTASIVDQQASLYGHGCRVPGDAKITFGTGAFALVLTGDRPFRSPQQGLLPTVAWQRTGQHAQYALDGGVYCAGSAVEWIKSLGLFKRYDEINQFDGDSAAQRDLLFVPALSGLACPHWDRRAGGLWIGLSLDTSAQDMVQSVLEGIAFRAAEVIRAMDRFITIGEDISIDGGVCANPYFCQFLADVLHRRVVVKTSPELTAMGTAELAGAILADTTGHGATTYEPHRDRSNLVDRFDEAITRAKLWRREAE